MSIRREIEAYLAETGLPWSIETGGRHHKIRVNGRFVGILPFNDRDAGSRSLKNIRAQIRRAARENGI